MIIELSTGKRIELSDMEYKELVSCICKAKAQYKLSNIPLIQSSDGTYHYGLYAGDKILDYFMQYGEKK